MHMISDHGRDCDDDNGDYVHIHVCSRLVVFISHLFLWGSH